MLYFGESRDHATPAETILVISYREERTRVPISSGSTRDAASSLLSSDFSGFRDRVTLGCGYFFRTRWFWEGFFSIVFYAWGSDSLERFQRIADASSVLKELYLQEECRESESRIWMKLGELFSGTK